jgi:DNA polymerase III alpha subunit
MVDHMSIYTIDEYGRAVVDSRGLFELWFRGVDEKTLSVTMDADTEAYNEQCMRHSKREYTLSEGTPPITHAERAEQWVVPEQFRELDIETWCLERCSTGEERERVRHELRRFAAYGMFPVLRSLVHMVEQFRAGKIVWGVGRGSSVASYVLFLIGVHKINPMKFNLEIEEFLR